MKIRLCKLVDNSVHLAQKCISGRNLMDNILSIDAVMHYLAITDPNLSACVLYDFSSAFPSLAHKYLWECLRLLGFDPKFIAGPKKFYANNVHFIKLAGSWEGSKVQHKDSYVSLYTTPSCIHICIYIYI